MKTNTYSNCMIIAILQKIKHPSNKLYLISSKNNHSNSFHVIWKDKYNNAYHFTRDKDYNVKHEWWFKGHIEKLHSGVLEKVKYFRFL